MVAGDLCHDLSGRATAVDLRGGGPEARKVARKVLRTGRNLADRELYAEQLEAIREVLEDSKIDLWLARCRVAAERMEVAS